MTSLHEAIADNLILDPETGEWGEPHAMPYEVYVDYSPSGGDMTVELLIQHNQDGSYTIHDQTMHQKGTGSP